jgi:hypothetical protein
MDAVDLRGRLYVSDDPHGENKDPQNSALTGNSEGAADPPEAHENHVRQRAHQIWVDEGRPEGRALDHWLRAKWELKSEPDRHG